jgi:hypothetical protein
MYKYYLYLTEIGPIYVVKEFEEINGQLLEKRMFEYYTEMECDVYYNYLMFCGGKKYLRYGDFEIQDGDFITTNTSIVELSEEQMMYITCNYLNVGISPTCETVGMILQGLSREEVDSILGRIYRKYTEDDTEQIDSKMIIKKIRKNNNKKEIKYNDKEEKKLNTFVSVFGDLFEEEKIRY